MIEIVAEVGSNWKRETDNESFDCVLEHIRQAARVGATVVKFQLFQADSLYSKERVPSQWEQAKQHELPRYWLADIERVAKAYNIKWWVSVFDKDSAEYVCRHVGVDGLKIASGDLTNHDLVTCTYRLAVATHISFAISTGAAAAYEINDVGVMLDKTGGITDTYIFQCVSAYPAAPADYNLSTYYELDKFGACDIGLSDHTPGINQMLIGMAVGLGYTAFEKHFTLDPSLDLPDNSVSLDPVAFSMYVAAIRRAETMYGDGNKRPMESELGERIWARRGKDGLRPAND